MDGQVQVHRKRRRLSPRGHPSPQLGSRVSRPAKNVAELESLAEHLALAEVPSDARGKLLGILMHETLDATELLHSKFVGIG